MATLANGQPTLLDVSTQFTSDGKPMPIAELLHKTNPILDDIPFEQANSTSGHQISARQQLPTTSLRRINGGVAPSKSGYGKITESMGLFAGLGQVDSKLVDLAGDKARFRMNENEGHIESMGQRFATSLIYGDPDVTPEEFLGLSPRYDSLAAANNTAIQIIDAGGNDTDLASIWLVGWGNNSVMGIYPQGSQAGIQHKDMGEELVDDGAGGKYPALRDWFELDAGLAVYDYRNVVRIANIDLSNLTTDAATGAKLIELMTFAVEGLNNDAGLNPVFYMPREVRAYLRQQITNKNNVFLSMAEVAGKKVVAFDGYPVRRLDALASNETRIT
jgi:hypothetical protein